MKPPPLALPLGCALLVLWGLIAAAVGWASPSPAFVGTKEKVFEQALLGYEQPLYHLQAQIMAKRLLNDPEARWSQELVDGKTGCMSIGNGYWTAHGIVVQNTPHGAVATRWEAGFVPGETELRYFRIGRKLTGDRSALLHAAVNGPPATTGP